MLAAIICGVYCLILPITAWIVINQDWYWDVPIIGITYKPWRLFLIICSLPGFFASLALFLIPESPKFTLGQGDENRAIRALKKVNRWNNGKNSELDIVELLEEPESIENREKHLANKNGRFPLINSIWSQTVPLFKPPYLGRTLLICLIQFITYATANGFYMFFTEILNRMANNLNGDDDVRMPMCDIINMNTTQSMGHVTDENVILNLNLF